MAAALERAPDLEPLPKPTADEVELVRLANAARQERGVKPVTIDPLLVLMARRHGTEMRDRGYFSHISPVPENRTPRERFLKLLLKPPDYYCLGENLYQSGVLEVAKTHQGWMESPGHRENLLSPRFDRVGIGVVLDKNGASWVTQVLVGLEPPP